jgi:hypothetical protein
MEGNFFIISKGQNISGVLNYWGNIAVLIALTLILLTDIFIKRKRASSVLCISFGILIILLAIYKLLYLHFADIVLLYNVLFNASFGFRFLPQNLVFLSLITTVYILLRSTNIDERWRTLTTGYVLLSLALISRTLLQFLIFLSPGILSLILYIIMKKGEDRGAIRRVIFVLGLSIVLIVISSGVSVYYGVDIIINGFIIQHGFASFVGTLFLCLASLTFMGVPIWRNWLPSMQGLSRTSSIFIETLLFIIGGLILINLGKSIERTSYIILVASIAGTIPGAILALKSDRKDVITTVRGTLGAIAGVGIGLGYSSCLRGAEIIIFIGALSTLLIGIFSEYKGIFAKIMSALAIAPITFIVPFGAFRGLSLMYYGINLAGHILTYIIYIVITITQALLILALFRLLIIKGEKRNEHERYTTLVLATITVPILYLSSIFTKYISFGYFFAGKIKIYPTPDLVRYFTLSRNLLVPVIGAAIGIILIIISSRNLNKLREDGAFIVNIKPVPFFLQLRDKGYFDLYNIGYGAIRISSFFLVEVLNYLLLIFERPFSFIVKIFNLGLSKTLPFKKGKKDA